MRRVLDFIEWIVDEVLEFSFFIVCGLILAAVVAVCMAGAYLTGSRSCQQKADAMGREHRYGLFTECLVQTNDGVFVPLDNYRLTQQENK